MRAVQLLLLYYAVGWCSSSGTNRKMSRTLGTLEYTERYDREIEGLQENVKELQDLNNQFAADMKRLHHHVKVLTGKVKGKYF